MDVGRLKIISWYCDKVLIIAAMDTNIAISFPKIVNIFSDINWKLISSPLLYLIFCII